MNPGSRRITIEWHRAGQPRAYADSEYVFDLTAEWIPSFGDNQTNWVPNTLLDSIIKDYGRVLGHWFPKDKEKAEWHHSKLVSFTKIGQATWRFQVTQPYLD